MSRLTEGLIKSMLGVFSTLAPNTEPQKIDLEFDFSLSFSMLMRI